MQISLIWVCVYVESVVVSVVVIGVFAPEYAIEAIETQKKAAKQTITIILGVSFWKNGTSLVVDGLFSDIVIAPFVFWLF